MRAHFSAQRETARRDRHGRDVLVQADIAIHRDLGIAIDDEGMVAIDAAVDIE